MRQLRSVWRGMVLFALAVVLVTFLLIFGYVSLFFRLSAISRQEDFHVEHLSQALTCQDGEYRLAPEGALPSGWWAILIGEDGHVLWQQNKPPEVPEQYTLQDVASFTRWYLKDYPVWVWTRPEGLLVAGAPKGVYFRYNFWQEKTPFFLLLAWAPGLLVVILISILLLAATLTRHWHRQEQRHLDRIRSSWIDGVSHDIRTPLSLVMGYAAQMEADPDLPPLRQSQARIICTQSQVIRDLVRDLNLTMQLGSAMEPLGRQPLEPSPFLRQTAADFLNSGLAQGYPFRLQLPDAPLPTLQADPHLLKRAIDNLLSNCLRHNAPGCQIELGAQPHRQGVLIWVQSQGQEQHQPQPVQPGEPPHGTGLKLVAQIAQAHGGWARFLPGEVFRGEIWLPCGKGPRPFRRKIKGKAAPPPVPPEEEP